MTPFVWSLMGEDAAEPLSHIITRKEAERKAGGGEFWWSIGSTIAKELEEVAISNGGSLPVFFSALGLQGGGGSKQQICVWNGWRSRDGKRRDHIPGHVLITSDYKPERPHYALVCHSASQVALGNHGYFDPVTCPTLSGKTRDRRQRTALLTGNAIQPHGPYPIAMRADLVSPWYVRLSDYSVLDAAELARIRQYKAGDDWPRLVNTLRQTSSSQ